VAVTVAIANSPTIGQKGIAATGGNTNNTNNYYKWHHLKAHFASTSSGQVTKKEDRRQSHR